MEITADDVTIVTNERSKFGFTYRLRPYCVGKRCRLIAGVILIAVLIIIGIVVLGVVFGIRNKSSYKGTYLSLYITLS